LKNPFESWTSSRRHRLVAILMLLMWVVPAARVVQTELKAFNNASSQAAGLSPAWDILRLVRSAQQHRGLSNGVLAGNQLLNESRLQARSEVDAALVQTRGALQAPWNAPLAPMMNELAVQWQVLATDVDSESITAEESFGRHTLLIDQALGLVKDIAELSGIAAIGEPADRNLQVAVLHHLPNVAEHLGRLRGEGAKLLSRQQATTDDRIELAADLQTAQLELQSALKALALSGLATPDGASPASIPDAASAALAAFDVAQRDVIDSESLDAAAADYFAAMTGAIDAQFNLIGTAFEVLRERLDQDRLEAALHLGMVCTATILLAAFGFWLLELTRRAQKEQEASDSRWRAIITALPDAVLVANEDGCIVESNPAGRHLFGADIIGKSMTSLSAAESQAEVDAEFGKQHQAAPLGQGTEPRQITGQRVDRSTFPAELMCFGTTAGPKPQIITIVRDISERQRLERKLSQSQKMEAIGQLTGGIAHDFNNLLGVIVGNLDLLERTVAHQETALKRVRTAHKAALRGADLTKRLLAFSRRQHLEPAPLKLTDAIANVVEMGARTLGPEIRVIQAPGDTVPTVMVDASALENALLNLLVNARDAMPHGGSVEIAASDTEIDAWHPAVRAGELAPGRYASLRVTDTGQGIPPEQLDKVFEPFFTTKQAGQGTGLGLAMVYGFVKQSGGHIKVYSEVGVGTSIAILLPIAAVDAEAVPSPYSTISEHRAKPGATALVVDDEPDLREVAATYLREMGYRVLTAADGPDALRTLASASDVDLLVTDVVMPGGMNGVKLSQHVRRSRPNIRVVFTSGFPSQALAQRHGTRVEGPLVNKPFQHKDFVTALNRLMAGEAA